MAGFWIAGQISRKNCVAGRKKNYQSKFTLGFFQQKERLILCVYLQILCAKTKSSALIKFATRAIKIFGRPHAVRGPHFGKKDRFNLSTCELCAYQFKEQKMHNF